MINFLLGAAVCFAGLLWYGKYLHHKRQQERLLVWRQPTWCWFHIVSVRRY